MRNRVGRRTPRPGIGHARAPSAPIDRRGRLMGTRRFDGYDCTGRRDARTERGGQSPDWSTVDLKACQLKKRWKWQLGLSARAGAAAAAVIYCSICSHSEDTPPPPHPTPSTPHNNPKHPPHLVKMKRTFEIRSLVHISGNGKLFFFSK